MYPHVPKHKHSRRQPKAKTFTQWGRSYEPPLKNISPLTGPCDFTMCFNSAPHFGHLSLTGLTGLLRSFRALLLLLRSAQAAWISWMCSLTQLRHLSAQHCLRNSPFFLGASVFLLLLLNSSRPIQLPLLGSQIPVIKQGAGGTVLPGD